MNNLIKDGREEKETKSMLAKIYDVIDWLDFSMIILVVAYVVMTTPEAAATFDPEWILWLNIFFDHFPLWGVQLYLFSFIVCLSAIVISIMLRKVGSISKLRLIFRVVIWSVWIPIDLYFLLLAIGWIG